MQYVDYDAVEIEKRILKRAQNFFKPENFEYSQLGRFNKKSYDATGTLYGKEIIIEVKHRPDKIFETKALECTKFFSLLQLADYYGKGLFYFYEDPKGLYIYNLWQKSGEIIQTLPIAKKRCKYSDHYRGKDGDKLITKYFYMLPASMTFKVDYTVKDNNPDIAFIW